MQVSFPRMGALADKLLLVVLVTTLKDDEYVRAVLPLQTGFWFSGVLFVLLPSCPQKDLQAFT